MHLALKHIQDYVLTTGKAGAKNTTSGNYFASLAPRYGWAGPCGTMWRLAHEPVHHVLHARKPFVINTENLSLKKEVPMKVLWLKKGDATASNQGGTNAGSGSASAASGSADGQVATPLPLMIA